MPQGALQANVATNPNNARAPLTTDASGNLLIGNGSLNKLNVTAATVIKAAPGRVCKITVNTVPTSSAVSVNDVTTTGGAAASNLVLSVASAQLTAGQIINLDFPCTAGIVVNPGTSGVVSVSFD
ncbi:hypothetical protein AB4Y43_01385 [Paraburkholderia sp. BR10872]|uniref:hypothetical protein n=1 Tax=Paraburkholderia sp. BR10872 TaxID=3236989 RepID=UPI0034D1F877